MQPDVRSRYDYRHLYTVYREIHTLLVCLYLYSTSRCLQLQNLLTELWGGSCCKVSQSESCVKSTENNSSFRCFINKATSATRKFSLPAVVTSFIPPYDESFVGEVSHLPGNVLSSSTATTHGCGVGSHRKKGGGTVANHFGNQGSFIIWDVE